MCLWNGKTLPSSWILTGHKAAQALCLCKSTPLSGVHFVSDEKNDGAGGHVPPPRVVWFGVLPVELALGTKSRQTSCSTDLPFLETDLCSGLPVMLPSSLLVKMGFLSATAR